MGRIVCPVSGWGCRINKTLHGRSVYRPVNVKGHNVFKGYTTWSLNGHKGVGDGLDLFGPGGSPVYAAHDGRIAQWRNDATKLEVVYLEGNGLTSVYAHVNFLETRWKVLQRVEAGDQIAVMRGDLSDPHLHFELWVDGQSVSGSTPDELRRKLIALSQRESGELRAVVVYAAGKHAPVAHRVVNGETYLSVADLASQGMARTADHVPDQGKLYVFIP